MPCPDFISYSAIFGGIWGLGHGLSSILIGLAVFKTINYINDIVTWRIQDGRESSTISNFFTELMECEECYKSFVDVIMGFTLLIVGCMGVRESCHPNSTDNLGNESVEHSTKSALTTNLRYFVTFLNGFVMGLSWDGIPSLTPAVFAGIGSDSYEDSSSALLYLISYAIATVISMSAICAVFGEMTCWIYKLIKRQQKSKLDFENGDNNVELIRKLSFNSSCISLVFGVLWMFFAAVQYAVQKSSLYIPLISRSHYDDCVQGSLSVGCVIALTTSTVWTMVAELEWPQMDTRVKIKPFFTCLGKRPESCQKSESYTV